MTDYNDISEWETNNGIAEVINKSLQNFDLPPNLIGVNSLFTLKDVTKKSISTKKKDYKPIESASESTSEEKSDTNED